MASMMLLGYPAQHPTLTLMGYRGRTRDLGDPRKCNRNRYTFWCPHRGYCSFSHPTFDFRIAVASFLIVQSSAASISGIPRLVAVLAAKDDEFFHTNSIRRRGPCGPENSKSGARCRAVGKIGGAEESAEPSRLAKDERRRLHWARERDAAQRPFGGMLLDAFLCLLGRAP